MNLGAESLLQRLKLPNLKRHCIIRGMPFDEVDGGILKLQSWLVSNYDNIVDTRKLDEYDLWIEKVLTDRNVDHCLLNPELKLGYVVETDKDGNVLKNKKIKGLSKNRKKPRSPEGLLLGTRKHFIVELQKQDFTLQEVIEKTKLEFEDINENYIITWFNKSKKGKLKK